MCPTIAAKRKASWTRAELSQRCSCTYLHSCSPGSHAILTRGNRPSPTRMPEGWNSKPAFHPASISSKASAMAA